MSKPHRANISILAMMTSVKSKSYLVDDEDLQVPTLLKAVLLLYGRALPAHATGYLYMYLCCTSSATARGKARACLEQAIDFMLE